MNGEGSTASTRRQGAYGGIPVGEALLVEVWYVGYGDVLERPVAKVILKDQFNGLLSRIICSTRTHYIITSDRYRYKYTRFVSVREFAPIELEQEPASEGIG
ncbi:hypothetical protein OPQ81_008660 [Rhizoctonia solani]|nr:hypothetical protein OPQ81_008660 [Rhizoctonia solani]